MMEKDVVIIGSGPAGLTAGIYCARANLKPLLVSGQIPGGQLTQTTDIENFPGFPDAVNGFELMSNMQKQAERFGTEIIYSSIKSVSLKDGGTHEITLENEEKIVAKSLIIATGASPRWMGLDAEAKLLGKGVSACATCDGAFYRDLPVVVVGGGDTAVEEAIFLTRFTGKVTLIHRRDQLRASKIMADRILTNPKVKVMWDSVVTDIIGNDEVSSVRVKNVKDNSISELECKGYFAALGHIPATDIFEGVKKNERGYIITKGRSSKTNIDGVFAAGDCADEEYQQAITAAAMGCRAAIDVEKWLESVE